MFRSVYLHGMVYFIAAVCAFDIYCTIKYSDSLYEYELNSVAKLLIDRHIETYHRYHGSEESGISYKVSTVHSDVSKLVLFKVIGLIISLEIFDMLIISQYKKIAGYTIFTVFIGQCFLLGFLLI